jgi:hypothetical protein
MNGLVMKLMNRPKKKLKAIKINEGKTTKTEIDNKTTLIEFRTYFFILAKLYCK